MPMYVLSLKIIVGVNYPAIVGKSHTLPSLPHFRIFERPFLALFWQYYNFPHNEDILCAEALRERTWDVLTMVVTSSDQMVNINLIVTVATKHHFMQKWIYFKSFAHQLMSASFRFFKMATRVDAVNVRGKSAKTRMINCILVHVYIGPWNIIHTSAFTFQGLITKKDKYYIPRPVTFLVESGVVLVAPRTGWCVIVEVRIASPSAKPASSQSQWRVGLKLHRADDVMCDRRREGLYITIVPLWLWVTYYTY